MMEQQIDREKDAAEEKSLKERFKEYNVLFATNGDDGKDSPMVLSINSYSDCVSDDNFIVLRSDNGQWYGKRAFLKIFEYGIERNFDYLIYVDADCFIAHSENLFSLFKKFVESGCILGGPSDGGIFCHRSVNRFSINPFLMFVDLKKVSKKFRNGKDDYAFNGSKDFSEDKVTLFSLNRYNDVFEKYRDFREKNADWFVVPHAIEIAKPHNEFEVYYGKNQHPWTCLTTTDFEPYYDIFLGMHDGEENVYFMYGRDYLCKGDPSGITSAVYLGNNITYDSKLVCLHTWFTRFSNSDGVPFERMTRQRIFSVGIYALEMNGRKELKKYFI